MNDIINKIKSVEKACENNIEQIVESLNLDFRKLSKYYVGACPVHGGDKENAFNLFYNGKWRCFTNGCHKEFGNGLVGFIRGYISHTKNNWPNGKKSSLNGAIQFLSGFHNGQIPDIKEDENETFKRINVYSKEEERVLNIEPEIMRKSLKIPSTYFNNRGFSKEILEKYDVGECLTYKKRMYCRATIPIFDEQYRYVIGCTGRSIFDVCELCHCHHNPLKKCPPEEYRGMYSKWKHSYGFKSENFLFNLWFSKEEIKKRKTAIIVESPGNVLRLEEWGIHNSVATFGSFLSNKHATTLNKLGVLKLIVMFDPDAAGKSACEEVKAKYKKRFYLEFPKWGHKDIADSKKEKVIDCLRGINEF